MKKWHKVLNCGLAVATFATLVPNTFVSATDVVEPGYIEVVPHWWQVRVSVAQTTTRTSTGVLSSSAVRGTIFTVTHRTQVFAGQTYIEICPTTVANGVFRGPWIRLSHTDELPGQGM